MNRQQLKQYKSELEKLERILNGGKINDSLGEAVTFDPKKRKFEFKDEKTSRPQSLSSKSSQRRYQSSLEPDL